MNKPTDAEIIALADETRTGEPGREGYILPISFARAVLDKWGQPAHSGEPVAWKHDCAALLTNDVELWIDACPHCGKPRNAPQPVEREPLTDEQIKDLQDDGVFLGTCQALVYNVTHGTPPPRRLRAGRFRAGRPPL